VLLDAIMTDSVQCHRKNEDDLRVAFYFLQSVALSQCFTIWIHGLPTSSLPLDVTDFSLSLKYMVLAAVIGSRRGNKGVTLFRGRF